MLSLTSVRHNRSRMSVVAEIRSVVMPAPGSLLRHGFDALHAVDQLQRRHEPARVRRPHGDIDAQTLSELGGQPASVPAHEILP